MTVDERVYNSGLKAADQIIPAAFDQDQFDPRVRGFEFRDRFQVHRGVLSDGRVQASAGSPPRTRSAGSVPWRIEELTILA